jgi:hypothetical protein
MFIKRNNTLDKFSAYFNDLIYKENYESALREIFFYSYIVFLDPIKNKNYKSSYFFDNLLCKLSDSFRKSKLYNKKIYSTYNLPSVNFELIIFCSKYQRTGGHSRIIDDVIDKNPGKKILVLSSELYGDSDHEYFNFKYAQNPKRIINFYPSKYLSSIDKLKFFSTMFDKYSKNEIYLLNNNSDPILLSAINYKKNNANIIYIHHGDYAFSLGATLKFTHYDLNKMQSKCCSNYDFYSHKIYNLYDLSDFKSNLNIKKYGYKFNSLSNPTKINFVVVGNYNKFFPSFFMTDLLRFYLIVLKKNNNEIFFIGKIPFFVKVFFKFSLLLNKINPNRAIFIDYSSDLYQTFNDIEAHVYVTSFPIFGGLSLLSALSFGLPVLIRGGHKNYFSGIPYLRHNSYLSWSSLCELRNIINNITPKSIVRYSSLSFKNFKEVFTTSKTKIHKSSKTSKFDLDKEDYFYKENTFFKLSFVNKIRILIYYFRSTL